MHQHVAVGVAVALYQFLACLQDDRADSWLHCLYTVHQAMDVKTQAMKGSNYRCQKDAKGLDSKAGAFGSVPTEDRTEAE